MKSRYLIIDIFILVYNLTVLRYRPGVTPGVGTLLRRTFGVEWVVA